jgi:hypothetical protein
MAAPTPTARISPTGIKLKDGYQALITFAVDPDCALWEKTVKPPGIDGGDPIEQTTMHNITWRTRAPRSLKTLTEGSFKAAYDPICYTQLLTIVNVETTITVEFADGSTVAFYGFLQNFDPDELVEGTQPEATCTICPTNFDHVNKVEAGPALSSVVGT